jgi:tRNA pseudouridine38-40 synthase
VHALGQVVSVALDSPLDTATLARALNAALPDDVRVTAVEQAAADFHARFSATGKVYEYRIWNGAFVPPFERLYAWHVPQPLDLERMRAAAGTLLGTHDFSAFRAAGDGFLRHMVRAVAGTLVDVGLGRRSVESVAAALASRDRAQAGPTAPAHGLFLVKVEY